MSSSEVTRMSGRSFIPRWTVEAAKGGQRKEKKSPPTAAVVGSHSDTLTTSKNISSEVMPAIEVRKEGKSVTVRLDDASLVSRIGGALGTNDKDSIVALLHEVGRTIPELNQDSLHWNHVVATLKGIGPQDVLERLLAVQMVAVHQVAMNFLALAASDGQTREATDANVNRATKLLRTFTAQMETLNRYRTKIIQQMIVGNVNVNEGGQAIVGAVSHRGPRKVSTANDANKVG